MDVTFSREDWKLFRSLATLPHKAGVPHNALGALVIKELVDNALDAGNAVDVVEREDGWVVITDDGPGIPHDRLATLFSIRRPLVSSKIVRLPQRGALGNGLRVVMGAVDGSRGQLRIATDGGYYELIPQEDGHTLLKVLGTDDHKGTRVEIYLGEELRNGRDLTSFSGMATMLAQHGTHYKGKTSAWWYDSDAFFELMQAAEEGGKTLDSMFTLFKGVTVAESRLLRGKLDLPNEDWRISRELAVKVLLLLRNFSPEMKPSVLGKIGDAYRGGYACVSGKIELGIFPRAELPFVIEVIASKANNDYDSAVFMVNRTRIVDEIVVRRYKPAELSFSGCGLHHHFKVTKDIPMFLIINVTTPYMPITTDGKQPDLDKFITPLFEGLDKAARGLKRSLAIEKSPTDKPMTQKDYIEANLTAAIAKASGNGRLRYSLRQLFYAVRPYLLEAFDKGLDYNYFASVITDVEAKRGGDLPGMYRDARGVIYHPHLKVEIPLGTFTAEEYKRPDWTFKNILYIEKKGLFELLHDVEWPERNDCALMSCQGFASRAARDVLDMLEDGDEEINFFCLHDADAAGTLIYQSLVEATRARPGRRANVINLGLEPDEAIAMDLQVEHFSKKGTATLPCADYCWEHKEWFQSNRVELNAMTSPQFLEWLDRKFEPYAGKVIPPEKVLEETYDGSVQAALTKRLTAKILEEAKINEQVAGLKGMVDLPHEDLKALVETDFETDPQHRWDAPINILADEVAEFLVDG